MCAFVIHSTLRCIEISFSLSFRSLQSAYRVLTLSLSLSHTHTDSQSCSLSDFLSLCSLRSLALLCVRSLCLSQLLLLPPTEADVATTRRCSSNYAGTHAYMFVCMCVCMCVCTRIWVNLKFLERKLVVPLAALQMDESDMAI